MCVRVLHVSGVGMCKRMHVSVPIEAEGCSPILFFDTGSLTEPEAYSFN